MSRDDYGDPGAATWGNPGAVTVGYIPEDLKQAIRDAGAEAEDRALEWRRRTAMTREAMEMPLKLGFDTSPQKDHGWRDLKIVSGQIIEGRDTGDEAE